MLLLYTGEVRNKYSNHPNLVSILDSADEMAIFDHAERLP